MGCGASKHSLDNVDDSVHVMLTHEKKVALKKGEKVATSYVPRAEHPLLHTRDAAAGNAAGPVTVAEEDDDIFDKLVAAEDPTTERGQTTTSS